jgi:hypothetical protein
MLLDSTDREDLQGFIRRLAEKGHDIPYPPRSGKQANLLFDGRLRLSTRG